MSEREETHDFMSVDSFSQLPFIRRRNPPSPHIRLFGFDFPPHASDAISNTSSATYPSSGCSEANTGSTSASASASASATKDCGKKFECQYCFRNFPTSQALGGHQNAHKRERQHAKRAYLAESHLNHQLCSHDRMGLSTVSAARFSFDHPRPPPHYPSWSLVSSGMAGGDGSFYSSAARPINSSPVLGLWRSQTAPLQLALFRGEDGRTVTGGGAGSWPSPPYASAWPREWHGREAKDGVISLDLHL